MSARDELRNALRAEVLREAADAISSLPQDYECDPGRGDAAELLRRMANQADGPARTQETGCAGFEPGDLCARCGDARRWHRAEGGEPRG